MESHRNSRHIVIFCSYLGVLALFGAIGWYCEYSSGFTFTPRAMSAEFVNHYALNPTVWQKFLRQEKILVNRGTVIGDYLGRYGIAPGEIREVIAKVRPVYDLAKIRAGRMMEFVLSRERSLLSFRYHIDDDSFLQVDRQAGNWTAVKKTYPFSWREEYIQGTIQDNLFNEIERLGEKPPLAVAMADLFAWDVDFYADLRVGDSFKVLIEKKYLDGQFMGYGAVLAAEFVNQGQSSRAIRYTFPDGHTDYFTPDGQSIRKELLKSPLKLGIVTSRFSRNRFHPTLKIYRPHLGVDIAAPVGTPVHAAGDGAVTFAGFRGQAGRMVEISHPNRFQTQYLHLSRFAGNIRIGARVRQGEVVGYVGMTGETSGPHLDYRIKARDAYVNPLKQQFQRATPLPSQFLPDFQKTSFALLRVLNSPGTMRDYYLALKR